MASDGPKRAMDPLLPEHGFKMSYYKYPDGTNCGYKTIALTKISGTVGFGLASFHVCHSPMSSFFDMVKEFPRFMVPPMLGGAAMGGVACYLAQIRGKDDKWNYGIGGATAGAVFGGALRSMKYSVYGAGWGVILGCFWKTCMEQGILPIKTPRAERYDWDMNNRWDTITYVEDVKGLTGDEWWNVPRGSRPRD